MGFPPGVERSARLVRIPRHLLHIDLDGLRRLDVSEAVQGVLRALLADLPLVPDASLSAVLVGPAAVTLPCLAVLARHVGQGLRDHNLSMADDRARLHLERRKLIFLDAAALDELLSAGDERPLRESVAFVVDITPGVLGLLAARDAAGLASFVTSTQQVAELARWRHLDLGA